MTTETTSEEVIAIQISRDAELPGLPNFIRLTNGDTIPLMNLSKSEVQTIGCCWANALVQKWEHKNAK